MSLVLYHSKFSIISIILHYKNEDITAS